MILLHCAAVAYSAYAHSPTLNEPGHIASGLGYWELGRLDLYSVNPPLPRVIAALPVYLLGYNMDWRAADTKSPLSRPEFSLGAKFIKLNADRTRWNFTLARLTCIPFSLLGAFTCYCWCQSLSTDRLAPAFAVCLWCADPNILAHSSVATADCAATAVGLTAGYCFLRWLNSPSLSLATGAGIFLGMAICTKFTWLLLIPLWPAIWIVSRIWKATYVRPVRSQSKPDSPQSSGLQSKLGFIQETFHLGLITLLALIFINYVYGFKGTLDRLDTYVFTSARLNGQGVTGTLGNRFRETWIGELPSPVPQDFLSGIDAQLRDFEAYPYPGFLHGEWSHEGWWWYYLYAAAVKTPHSLQILATVYLISLLYSLFSLTTSRREKSDSQLISLQTRFNAQIALVLPALFVFISASLQTRLNHHFRYVLPAYACIIPLSALGTTNVTSLSLLPFLNGIRFSCIAFHIASAAIVSPHSISYFNDLSGGPLNGHVHLLGSNLDWGQDLWYLKTWITDSSEGRPIELAYYGLFDPSDVGFSSTHSADASVYQNSADRPDGQNHFYSGDGKSEPFLAVSANLLFGVSTVVEDGNDGTRKYPSDAFTAFRDKTPVAMCGYSIFIFDGNLSPINDKNLTRSLSSSIPDDH